MIITPYFVQPSQDELFEHFTAVAKAASLPILLYNNPPRTGVNILPRTLARCMAAAENIVGVKDSSGDLTQAIEYQLNRSEERRVGKEGGSTCRSRWAPYN